MGYSPWSRKVGHNRGANTHSDVIKSTLPIRPVWCGFCLFLLPVLSGPFSLFFGLQRPWFSQILWLEDISTCPSLFLGALPQHFLFLFLLPFSGKHQCPQRGLPLYLIFSGFPVVFRCLFLCFPPYIYPLNKACNDFCCCVYLFFIRNLSLSGFSGEGNDNLLQYSCS